jgi:hypothetical protein
VRIDGLTRFDFHAAAQHRAILNHQAFRLQVSRDVPGAPKLNLLAAYDFSVDATAHNHFARKNVGFHDTIRPDRQAAIAQIYFALEGAVDEKIFAAGDFALNANSLTDAGGRF